MHPKSILRIFIPCLSAVLVYSFVTSAFSAVPSAPAPFDGEKSFAVLKAQCDFGPRPVGTEAHRLTRSYLAGELAKYADSVELRDFNCELGGKIRKLTNIIGRFGQPGGAGVLLCAHWDTRPIADRDLDPLNRKTPIVGANDGASGVAVLLELARIFKQTPPKIPVTIVLFDGEDYGPTGDDMFLGSHDFAARLGAKPGYRFGILLDMIGDRNLGIYRERNSQIAARQVNDLIWAAAKGLGYGQYFIDRTKYSISDDHLPLIEAGLPCVDLIDFDYLSWHTIADTEDKCSPESLKIVGDVIARVVYSQ